MIFTAAKKLISDYGMSYSASFLGFLIITISARILGAEEFSIIAVGLALGNFAIPLTTLGSDSVFVRDALKISNASHIPADQKKILIGEMAISSFGMRMTTIIAIATLVTLSIPLHSSSLQSGLAAASVGVWAAMQGLYPASWFDYLGKTRVQNIVVGAERLITLAAIACLSLAMERPSALALGMILIATRLASIAFQLVLWSAISQCAPFKLKLVLPKSSTGVNFLITLASVFYALMIYGNQLFLKDEKVELAAYSLAFQIMGLIFIFQGQAQRLLKVKIAEDCQHRERIVNSLTQSTSLIAGGSAILSLGGWLLIELLPLFLNDPEYLAMSKFAPLLCVWVVVAGAGVAIAQYMFSLHQERFYLISAMGSGVIAVALGYLIIPENGGIAVVGILLLIHTISITANLSRVLMVSRYKHIEPRKENPEPAP